MGFFDAVNPFKKKEDDILPPLEGPNNQNQQFSQQNLNTPGMPNPPQRDALQPMQHHEQRLQQHSPQQVNQYPEGPHLEQTDASLSDHRMKMPLGENMRQERINNMHGLDSQQESQQLPNNPLQKDLELISSKLDYLKASLDHVNHRLNNLERLTKEEIDQRKW